MLSHLESMNESIEESRSASSMVDSAVLYTRPATHAVEMEKHQDTDGISPHPTVFLSQGSDEPQGSQEPQSTRQNRAHQEIGFSTLDPTESGAKGAYGEKDSSRAQEVDFAAAKCQVGSSQRVNGSPQMEPSEHTSERNGEDEAEQEEESSLYLFRAKHFAKDKVRERRRCRLIRNGASTDILSSTSSADSENPSAGLLERISQVAFITHTDPHDIEQRELNQFDNKPQKYHAHEYQYASVDGTLDNEVEDSLLKLSDAVELLKMHYVALPPVDTPSKMTTDECCKEVAICSLLDKWYDFIDAYALQGRASDNQSQDIPPAPSSLGSARYDGGSGAHLGSDGQAGESTRLSASQTLSKARGAQFCYPSSINLSVTDEGGSQGSHQFEKQEEHADHTHSSLTQPPKSGEHGFTPSQLSSGQSGPEATDGTKIASVPPGFSAEDRAQAVWGDFDILLQDESDASGGGNQELCTDSITHQQALMLAYDGGMDVRITESGNLEVVASERGCTSGRSEFEWHDEELEEELRICAAREGVYATLGRGDLRDDATGSTGHLDEAEAVELCDTMAQIPSTIPNTCGNPYGSDAYNTYVAVKKWRDMVVSASIEAPEVGSEDNTTEYSGANGGAVPPVNITEGRGLRLVVSQATQTMEEVSPVLYVPEAVEAHVELVEEDVKKDNSDGGGSVAKAEALRRLAVDAEEFKRKNEGKWRGFKRAFKAQGERIGGYFTKK